MVRVELCPRWESNPHPIFQGPGLEPGAAAITPLGRVLNCTRRESRTPTPFRAKVFKASAAAISPPGLLLTYSATDWTRTSTPLQGLASQASAATKITPRSHFVAVSGVEPDWAGYEPATEALPSYRQSATERSRTSTVLGLSQFPLPLGYGDIGAP